MSTVVRQMRGLGVGIVVGEVQGRMMSHCIQHYEVIRGQEAIQYIVGDHLNEIPRVS
jgi:hypothetical protein